MLFAVGSLNPVKINAVKKVVIKIWPEAKVKSLNVESGVSNQPIGIRETMQGAINRAKKAMEQDWKADFGVGLEGGITNVSEYGYFNIPWCAIIDRNGVLGLGSAGGLELPDKIVADVLKGQELGFVMDEKTCIKNSKQKMGAIGILTDGLLDRQSAYETMVIYALSKFIKPEFYK